MSRLNTLYNNLYAAQDAYGLHVRDTNKGVTGSTVASDLALLQREGEELADFAVRRADAAMRTYWTNERPTAERLVEVYADDSIEAYGVAGAGVVRAAARLALAEAGQALEVAA